MTNPHRFVWASGLRTSLLFPLTLLALHGCDADGGPPDDASALDGAEMADEPELPAPALEREPDVEIVDDAVLSLTGLGSDAPVLDVLASDVEFFDGSGLDPQALVPAVAASRALAIDLARTTAEQIESWRPLFEAARDARVPIIFDRATDSAAMARALGFGIEADTVVAESRPYSPGYRLRVFGARGLQEVEGEEQTATMAAPDESGEADPMTATGDDGDDGDDGDPLARDRVVIESPAPTPQTVARLVLEHLDAIETAPAAMLASSLPTGSYAHYDVLTGGTWSPVDGQTASMDVDFAVDLYAADNIDRKYMVVTPMGSGVNPGSLKWDIENDRGYFQERLDITVRPLHDELHSYKHAPLTDNVSSSYTTSTNMSVGATASVPPAINVEFGEGTSSSVALQSFGVIDQSVGRNSRWSFRMTARGDGGGYGDWLDLVDEDFFDPDVHGLPGLAKSTLAPQFETVYWADEDFTGVARTRLQYSQVLRNTWITGSWPSFTARTKATSATIVSHVAVDFGRIDAPQSGTLRFDERWLGTPVPDRWNAAVQEGQHDSASWDVTAGNWVHHTGNAYGTGPDGLPRGTYQRAHTIFMGEGSASVTVWPNDDDTWGMMYSVQDAANYYRAEIDKERDFARIVKVEDGVGTVLATVPAPAFGLSAWHRLRVERQGTAHHLYLNDVKLVTTYDTTFGSGAIALYAWAMSDVYFGRVRVRRPFEPDRNLAYGRPASQSSTYHPAGVASHAVDGGTDGHYEYRSVTHTDSESQPWWMVDLGSGRTVNDVVVWNRTDCCTSRLSNFTVELLDDGLGVVTSAYHPGAASTMSTFDMGGAQGRYVRIRLDGTGYLSLAEVEVFGPVDD